jgi:hypothetical protein
VRLKALENLECGANVLTTAVGFRGTCWVSAQNASATAGCWRKIIASNCGSARTCAQVGAIARIQFIFFDFSRRKIAPLSALSRHVREKSYFAQVGGCRRKIRASHRVVSANLLLAIAEVRALVPKSAQLRAFPQPKFRTMFSFT